MEPICIKVCLNCGCDVPIFHKARVNRNTFCSTKCLGEYRRKLNRELHPENIHICEFCGKEYYCKPYHAKRYNTRCCSRECFNKLKSIIYSGEGNHQYGLIGNLNASWKSDEKINVYGYRLIRCPNHPFKTSDDFVLEHRLIAEKFLLTDENSIIIDGKKYLKDEYVVHHIDHNKLNNSVENLKIYTRGEHTSLHKKGLI